MGNLLFTLFHTKVFVFFLTQSKIPDATLMVLLSVLNEAKKVSWAIFVCDKSADFIAH